MSLTRPCLGPKPGIPCPYRATTINTRCPLCRRATDRARGTRQQRGYGAEHQAVRRELADTLPARCGYCPSPVLPDTRWVAAHVVDGRAEFGWMVAHADCNERAKRR